MKMNLKLRPLLVLFVSLTIIGCGYVYGPVKEVEAFGNAVEPFMEELQKTVAADPSVAGVNKAAKLWDSKKADLKAKRDAIDAAPQGKNSDWQGLFFKILDRSNKYLDNIQQDPKLGYESDAYMKFKELRKDIETSLKLK